MPHSNLKFSCSSSRSSLALGMLASLAAFASLAQAQQTSWTLRILDTSTLKNSPCNPPCRCVLDPVPEPIGGRIYLAVAPSIPEVSALSGPFRLSTSGLTPTVLSGRADFLTVFDPALLSRLTLSTQHEGEAWTIDSGFFNPINPPFPTLIRELMSQQIFCTTLGVSLQTVETCVTDFDDGSGRGFPDGGVTIDDLLYYLSAFEAGDAIADIDDGDGLGSPDFAVTIDDLLYFLLHFEGGC